MSRDERRQAARVGTAVCAGLAAVLALAYFPRALDRFGDGAAANSAANYDDREFAGGNAIVVDKAALYEARALIPENGTYRVLTGPLLRDASPLTSPFAESFIRYFLMPRRPSASANWILCYGCEPDELEGAVEVVWHDDVGIALLKRRQ